MSQDHFRCSMQLSQGWIQSVDNEFCEKHIDERLENSEETISSRKSNEWIRDSDLIEVYDPSQMKDIKLRLWKY